MMEEEINQQAPVTGEMIALLTVLSLFTIVGTVGNGLVLFVFSRVRDKTTAQLFILSLAMIDLFTCMMIIPMTMYVEYTRYDIKFDWLCKLYQFLITSKVPLSAFIMVAIAFDRYFCICHPLRKIITPWRTKVTLVSLTLFAATLGMMTSMAYGVNQVFSPDDLGIYNSILNSSVIPVPPDTIKDWTKLGEDPSTKNDITMSVELRLKLYMLKRNTSSLSFKTGAQETVYIGICAPNEILLDWDFVSVYQKCYTVLFLICLVIVGVLYGMIYRFIGVRRNKKLQQRLVLCAYVNSTHGYRDAGTRITFVNSNIHDNHNDDDKFETSSQGLGPGGIYIGDCAPTPPLHPHSEHTNVRKAGSSLNVSFAEPESGKPAPEGSDEKMNGVEEVVVAAASVIGNSHNVEVSVTSEVERERDPKRTQSEEPEPRKHSGTSLQSAEDTDSKTSDIRKSSEAIHHSASNENDTVNNRKQAAHKSPSLGSSARTRRKRLWKSSRRPKSFAEDPGSKDGGAPTHKFCKRRASSPFKRETGEASTKHAPWVEMRNLPCRRDSEPFRNVAADAFPDLYSRISRRKGEDFLTMGSRKHYDANYLETSIEEDCSTSVPPRYTPLSSDTTGDVMFRRDGLDTPAVPVIQVINNGGVPDPAVLQHHTGDLSDSDTAEAQTPLLHGVREDYPNEKKDLYTNKPHSFKDAAPLSLSTPPYPCDVEVSNTNSHVEFMDSTQPHKHETDLDKPFITVDDSEIRSAADVLSNPFIGTDTPGIHISASNTQPSCTKAPEIRVVPTSPPSTLDAPEIRVFESLWNNQVPQGGAQQPALLTTYVRNISPSSGGSCHVSPRPSYSDVSHHWTMEESSVGGFPGLDPGHLLIPGTSRRSTMESRSSTMDGSVPRPRTARKKRWQHFRSKNASIKGNQGRHYRATSGAASASFTGNSESVFYGRRSVVSYDADRLRDETRAANARTALMLFTVTLVFVVAFLPAWLMAHRLVPTQLMVFYLYFTYNVANPFIYAFMNAIFKEQLRKIFRCWRKGDLC